MDEETGLYYFGARYYDPRASLWVSVDPILGDYLPSAKEWAGDTKKNEQNDMAQWLPEPYQWNPQTLRGMGGVYSPTNLNLYNYVGNNPVRFIDPDGRAQAYSFVGTVGPNDKNPYTDKSENAVDEAARIHDINYDKVSADGLSGVFLNPSTTKADLQLAGSSLNALVTGKTNGLMEASAAIAITAVFMPVGFAKMPLMAIQQAAIKLNLIEAPKPNQRMMDAIANGWSESCTAP